MHAAFQTNPDLRDSALWTSSYPLQQSCLRGPFINPGACPLLLWYKTWPEWPELTPDARQFSISSASTGQLMVPIPFPLPSEFQFRDCHWFSNENIRILQCNVVLKLDCIFYSPGKFFVAFYLIPVFGPSHIDSDLMVLGRVTVISICRSFPGGANMPPGLRTTVLMGSSNNLSLTVQGNVSSRPGHPGVAISE